MKESLIMKDNNAHRLDYHFPTLRQRIYFPFKRLFDIILSLLGIILCAVFIWWWVLLINAFVTKGHPFFTQKRLGKFGKVFTILKFRSMKNDSNPYLSPFYMSGKEQYLMETRFGHFLRRSQIDETPQLINILFGKMSFIGPRPCMAKNEEYLVNERKQRNPNPFLVRPGLTGLSQVTIENMHDPVMKAETDSFYLKKMTFLLDFFIILKTLAFIFFKKNRKSM